MSLEQDFVALGIAEEPYDHRPLRTAKARLRAYLAVMTLEEILDRLWRQTPGRKDEEKVAA